MGKMKARSKGSFAQFMRLHDDLREQLELTLAVYTDDDVKELVNKIMLELYIYDPFR